MSRYAKPIPVDVRGNTLTENQVQLKAASVFSSENGIVSSVITFGDNITDLEISSSGAPVFIRWVPRSETAAVGAAASVITAAAGANYDHAIPNQWIRKFTIPIEQLGTSSLVGANIANGLYNRVAWKTAGNGSILATLY